MPLDKHLVKLIGVDFTNRTRTRSACVKRQVVWYILSLNGYSTSKIGKMTSYSRTTVIHGIKTIGNLISQRSHEIAAYIHIINYFASTKDQNGIT
jgi:chromosomal replication initiation ATPase DnaA